MKNFNLETAARYTDYPLAVALITAYTLLGRQHKDLCSAYDRGGDDVTAEMVTNLGRTAAK